MKTPWDYEITNINLPPIIDAIEFDAITGGVMSSTTEQVTKKLEGVSSAIRDYCGWHVSPIRTCVYIGNGEGRLLVLPAMLVTAIDYVKIDGVSVEFEWQSNGLVRLKQGRFPDSWRTVECRYSAGVDSSSVLGEIVAQIAGNALAAAPGIVEEHAGSVGATYNKTGDGITGGVSLLARDKALLAPYKLVRAW